MTIPPKPSHDIAAIAGRPWTHTEAVQLGGATMTLRRDQFNPPVWQVWNAGGDRLLAAFATRELLYAGLPGIRNHLLTLPDNGGTE